MYKKKYVWFRDLLARIKNLTEGVVPKACFLGDNVGFTVTY